jgi:hypothetical protein
VSLLASGDYFEAVRGLGLVECHEKLDVGREILSNDCQQPPHTEDAVAELLRSSKEAAAAVVDLVDPAAAAAAAAAAASADFCYFEAAAAAAAAVWRPLFCSVSSRETRRCQNCCYLCWRDFLQLLLRCLFVVGGPHFCCSNFDEIAYHNSCFAEAAAVAASEAAVEVAASHEIDYFAYFGDVAGPAIKPALQCQRR